MEVFVSMIMPVYNAEKYLKEAVESCLAQSYQNFELILVDDKSTDHSFEIIKDFKDKYLEKIKVISLKNNSGASGARNKGIKLAEGEYIVFVDSDDIQNKERVEKIVDTFETNKVDIVLNNCLMVNEKGESLHKDQGFPKNMNNQNVLLLSLRRNYFWTSQAAVKNDPLIRFDDTLARSEDYDLFLKLICHDWKFTFIKDKLVKYRLHSSNDSSDYKKQRKATIQILNKYSYQDLYDKLIEKGHSEQEILITLGQVCNIKRDYNSAVKYFHKAEGLSSSKKDKLKIYFYLGVSYYNSKQICNSYNYFQQCYKLKETDPAVINNYAVVSYLQDKDRDKANELFKAALKLKPGYMDVQFNLEKLGKNKTPDKITENFLRKNLIHTDYIAD